MAAAEAAAELRHTLRFLRQAAQFGAACWCIDRYVFHLSMTSGPSMMPTLNEMGDIVLVDSLSPRFAWWAPIRRNDIVVADSSYKRDYTVCKRVVGLPGDAVRPPRWPNAVVVPPGHVWLEGDNPQDSVDSRYYGAVPMALVRGRVAARVWPLSQARWFSVEEPRPTANTLHLAAMQRDEVILEDARARWAAYSSAAGARQAHEAMEAADAALMSFLRRQRRAWDGHADADAAGAGVTAGADAGVGRDSESAAAAGTEERERAAEAYGMALALAEMAAERAAAESRGHGAVAGGQQLQ